MIDRSHISRREFILRAGKAAGAVTIAAGLGVVFHEQERHPFAQHENDVVLRDLRIPGVAQRMIAVNGDDPALMAKAAIHELGGMGVFIQKGDIVVVKPNIGWDRTPEQAANTNPDVVRAIVELCVEAGASRIIVTDVSCNETKRCFYRSGIAQAAEQAGAVIEQPIELNFREVNMGGAMLGKQLVLKTFLEADKFINIPIAKHHSLTGATLGMKNLYGILGGNRSRLHQDIHNSIADLLNFLRPTLTIMDSYRALMRNGPQGGNLADVKNMRRLVASTDPVAIDAYTAETIFGLSVEQLPYLTYAEKNGLGISRYRELPIYEVTL